MRIVFWNCNVAFRKKYKELSNLKSDLYIIAEPEKLDKISFLNTYDNKIQDFIPNERNGLIVFTPLGEKIKFLKWSNYRLHHMVPIYFLGYKILCVWTKGSYIEDLYTYCAINSDNLDNTIIIGDFNSNVKWDKKHRDRNHSEFNKLMKTHGLNSAYHIQNHETFGEETKGTFFKIVIVIKNIILIMFICQVN